MNLWPADRVERWPIAKLIPHAPLVDHGVPEAATAVAAEAGND